MSVEVCDFVSLVWELMYNDSCFVVYIYVDIFFFFIIIDDFFLFF